MAFDQTTRNRLQRFVNSAREILSDEFTRQLQAVYGMDPKQGTVADISSLTHLNNSQRQTAHILRETLEHYLATTPGKSDKDRVKQVLSRIVREQAFTVLNRLAALRMAEARDFLLESVGKGQSSKGFQLYRQLAGTSHGETGDAYRNYLFSLFDEFSIDLAVLFDRYSTQGRLFPRESALLELLAEINHHEIEALWAEDETIGWIYQYFNSQEERKKMRAESQAPRNSRELAVRNQFFTPRYVVEFLTDNTLGRIWYEMTQGNTALIDSCSYLVRRPTEIFLKPGEQSPETDSVEGESLSQDELLKQPVYIPYRKLKDPRSIRMLDPACGSMHFGLYAFDLYEQIYLEAWQLEQELGPDAFQREANQQALQTSFANLYEFKAQIPKLIIENNIHGVDIDPRAVQIAGLSLWQRAQRSWQQQGMKTQQRPVIVKSNIVCAESMPGDKDLLKEFTGKLHPPALGQLVEVIFDKMELAGEAGTLLKIEEEIQTAIDNARAQWETKKGSDSIGDLFQDELEAATPQHELGFDLYGIDNKTFWDDAEQLILKALNDYADRAEFDTDQKRLFAEDAAKGFAFIDLCRKHFDVVLMNPPFGEFSEKFKDIATKQYSGGAHDIIAAFIERMVSLKYNEGLIGCISSRAVFYGSTNAQWRERIVIPAGMQVWIELGEGVLDDAMVETIMYTLGDSEQSVFYRKPNLDAFLSADDLEEVKRFTVQLSNFNSLKNSPFSYWISNKFLSSLREYPSFKKAGGNVKVGLQTGDDFRFIRLWFETKKNYDESVWFKHAKGGDNSPFFTDIHLLVNWGEKGREVSAQPSVRLNMYSDKDGDLYLKEGLTFSYRTYRFSPAILPENTITGVAGMGLFPPTIDPFLYLGYFNSSIANEFINFRLGNIDSRSLYQAGVVSPTPVFEFNDLLSSKITELSKENYNSLATLYSFSEFSERFNYEKFLLTSIQEIQEIASQVKQKLILNYLEIDKLIMNAMDFTKEDFVDYSKHTSNFETSVENLITAIQPTEYDYLSVFFGIVFGMYEIHARTDSIKSQGIIENEELTGILLSSEYSFKIKHLIKSEHAELLLKPLSFFNYHIQKTTRSRRQSPVYWPLQTPSGSYTLWVYYHRLNEQTLYTCINDFVEPKLAIVTADLNALRNKSARSTEEEKELAQLTDLEAELKDFRDELLRLAKFWKPNLNDGVQITAAPLWKLFQHKAWQKKLKETWSKLEDGDYDWAHLAGSVWPERVLRKCHQDRSLAIAHEVEGVFWYETEVPIMRGKKPTGNTKIEWQPKKLTDAELTALIKQTVIDSK